MTGAPARSFPEATAASAPGRLPSQHAARAAQTRARSVLAVAGDPRSRRRRMRCLGGHASVSWRGGRGQGVALIRTPSPSPGLCPRAPSSPPSATTAWRGGLGSPFCVGDDANIRSAAQAQAFADPLESGLVTAELTRHPKMDEGSLFVSCRMSPRLRLSGAPGRPRPLADL